MLSCPCFFRASCKPVLHSEHFGVRPSFKDWLRILGTHVGGQASCFFLAQCPWPKWDEFRVANLFGTGTYVVPAFIVLSGFGLAFVRLRPFAISAFLAGIVYIMATVSYQYIEGRFYIPVFFLLVALAVLPAQWAVGQALESRFSVWNVGVLGVFVLSCIGYPSIPSLGRSSLRKRRWTIASVRGAKGIQSHLPRRTWYCLIRHRAPLFECPAAQAICSCPHRRYP